MARPKIAVVLGTRPEAVKLAPVLRALRRGGRASLRVVLTGQHERLVLPVLSFFGLRADEDLRTMRPAQTPAGVAGRVFDALVPWLRRERPDRVVVQGDTVSALAAAEASFLLGIPVAHVEAGLRTFDPGDPFPEEICRTLVARMADLQFAPTRRAAANLRAEGIPRGAVRVTGNPVLDALVFALSRPRPAPPAPVPPRGGVILFTCHRRESFGAPIRGIFGAVRRIARRHPETPVVFPVHPNPAVSGPARRLAGEPGIAAVPPLSYPALAGLLERARIVLTDSGGLQEEATWLGRPLVVLRRKTERPEAVESGGAVLAGSDPDRIESEVERLFSDPAAYARMARPRRLFGDARSAPRIARALLAAH